MNENTPLEIVLATRNRDKVREITAILAPLAVRLRTVADYGGVPEVVEDGETLEANALKKARTVRDATGCSALADDTGLEVDALGGKPGVYSSRYAGEGVTYDDNNRKLLADLADVAEARRSARFRCVMALALTADVARMLPPAGLEGLVDEGNELSGGGSGSSESASGARPNGTHRDRKSTADALLTEGFLHGRIAPAKRGSGGFGYDPVFEVEGTRRTLAELSAAEKNQMSHRYRALVEMRELLLRLGLAGEREVEA